MTYVSTIEKLIERAAVHRGLGADFLLLGETRAVNFHAFAFEQRQVSTLTALPH